MITPEYAAGLFDGEGCISFYRSHGYCKPAVLVANSHEGVLFTLAAQWGGHVYPHPVASPRRLRMWAWRVFGREAGRFLLEIRASAIIKREEIDLSLPFFLAKRGQFSPAENELAFAALRALRASRYPAVAS